MSGLEAHVQRQIEHSRELFWHRLRWRALAAYLPADRPFTLVDVGAGAGLLGDFLRRRFPLATYKFVEPLPALARHLEAVFGAAANLGGEAPFHGIDVVTLMDVLEHQADDHRFLAELVARMEPGATLIVTVPALASLWSQWDEALGHQRRYDKPMLRRCCAGLPVELRELSYLFPEMIPLGWLRRLRAPASRAQATTSSAEFPDLPRLVNHLLVGLGLVSLRLRRWWPAGTTLFAVLVRR